MVTPLPAHMVAEPDADPEHRVERLMETVRFLYPDEQYPHDETTIRAMIVQGGTDKSYGIQVARLAGVPKPVIERAKEILSNLEEAELTPEGKPPAARNRREREKLQKLGPAPQLDLFRQATP